MATENKKNYFYEVARGKAYFTFVHAPQKDEMYGDKYKVDLTVEDEEGNPFYYLNEFTGEKVNMVELFTRLGKEIKEANAHIPARYVRLYTQAIKKDGTERGPIPTKDAKTGEVLTADTLIGNGSTIRVRMYCKPYGPGERKISAKLDRVIVEELVPYVSAQGKDEFDFFVPNATAPKAQPKAASPKNSSLESPFNDEIPF